MIEKAASSSSNEERRCLNDAENNGRKLESGQCLQTNQESGSGMSVIRQ